MEAIRYLLSLTSKAENASEVQELVILNRIKVMAGLTKTRPLLYTVVAVKEYRLTQQAGEFKCLVTYNGTAFGIDMN